MPIAKDEDVARAAEILRSGGVVAFPTETVYGLGADALNPQAVARVFAIKRRPPDHPLIVHLPDVSYLKDWACDIPRAAYRLAEKFWPGPLTLVLKRAAIVPDSVTGGQDSVGLRVPGHPVALALLEKFGGAVAAPSANRFGHVSPTRAEHVREELGSEADMILDGGPCRVGLESTIVSLLDARPLILRPGAISRSMLAEALGEEIETGTAEKITLRAPGMLASHYAPRTPLHKVPAAELYERAFALVTQGQQVGVLTRQAGEPAPGLHYYLLPSDPKGYAHELYDTLHKADARRLDVLLIEEPPQEEAWLAVRDRLSRATSASKLLNSSTDTRETG
ncbi:MAG TPA: L-threonylcarbamoyladenylate synthase [Gammaproteobacteria bacterium]|nr:L-threonylcarbamoyladenylate synthase [Gammaproteobacteria bacterium]